MHVRDQIVAATVELVKGTLPVTAGRVYPYGRVDWDQRSFPFAIVTAGTTRVQIEPGTGERIQVRETELTVSIHDVSYEDEDYSVAIGNMSAAVEKAMTRLEDEIPIGSTETTGDTGVIDLDLDAAGLAFGSATTFAVVYYTLVGDVQRLHLP